MPSAAQKKVQDAFKKARKEGLGGKALGRRIKQLLGKRVKSSPTKVRKSKSKKTKTRKSKSTRKSPVAAKRSGSRKGASLKTRLVKFGAGAGIGALLALIATAAKRQEINAAAPIIDAAAGTGVEGQIGTAIMRTVVPLITRGFRNGNTSNGNMMLEGA